MTITREELETELASYEGERSPPVHPGEILREEFLAPLGLSTYALAKRMHVPANRLGAILSGERSITADTAVRLGKVFGTRAEFWLDLQASHDLDVARRAHVGADVEPIAA